MPTHIFVAFVLHSL